MKLPLVVVLGTVALGVSYNQRMLDPLTAIIARENGFELDRVVLFATAFLLPYALGQPIIGPMADSIGKAKVLRISMLLILISDLLSFFVTSYWGLFGLRVLAGLGAGGIIPVGIALIADRTPVEKRQVALSHFMSVMMVGQLYAAPLSAAIAQKAGWQFVFPVAGAIALLAIAMLLWQVHPNPNAVRQPFSARRAVETYRTILGIPAARACYVAVLAEGLFIFGFMPHIAPYMEQHGYGGALETGVVLAAIGVGGIVYAASVSFLTKRFSLYGLMQTGGILVTLGMVAGAMATGWKAMTLAMGVMGFGFYMLHSGIQTRVTEVLPESRASVVSLHAFFMFIGFGAGPMLFGWLDGRIGTLGAFLLEAAAILIVSIAATQFLKRRANAASG